MANPIVKPRGDQGPLKVRQMTAMVVLRQHESKRILAVQLDGGQFQGELFTVAASIGDDEVLDAVVRVS